MKPLTDLIDMQDPGWAVVETWLSEATNPYEILPKDPQLAERALCQLQVTTRSSMGAVVYETGGLLIDGGWLRILGSGHSRLPRDPAAWTQSVAGMQAFGGLLIADDASGGFFAINGGGLGEEVGNVYYFAPDSLAWESLEVGYSAFVQWTLCGDLALFYQTVRWPGWQDDVAALAGDKVFSFYPFLWTEPQMTAGQRSRTAVPVDEHWALCQELQQQLAQ
ncbi:DUF2625 domain-containing protein [Kosakonia sp.]|uniref:DUF2625 domain-containing protein n=1 Tax=Kosakonia sp. TaxID=1916651 RepID=UPI00289CC0C5|nr:DUF2625 domain-containing protein [Kosakonia sp.]